MNGASTTQIIILLAIGWIGFFMFGWTIKELFGVKKVKCPWGRCLYNDDGHCCCKDVELDTYIMDDHFEALYCKSFESEVCNGQKNCTVRK